MENIFCRDAPIDYFFLDQFYNKQYEKDDRFGKVFSLFTGLAIFIASLGLLGLASFVTAQRTKEIGIRKVLGSIDLRNCALAFRKFYAARSDRERHSVATGMVDHASMASVVSISHVNQST